MSSGRKFPYDHSVRRIETILEMDSDWDSTPPPRYFSYGLFLPKVIEVPAASAGHLTVGIDEVFGYKMIFKPNQNFEVMPAPDNLFSKVLNYGDVNNLRGYIGFASRDYPRAVALDMYDGTPAGTRDGFFAANEGTAKLRTLASELQDDQFRVIGGALMLVIPLEKIVLRILMQQGFGIMTCQSPDFAIKPGDPLLGSMLDFAIAAFTYASIK